MTRSLACMGRISGVVLAAALTHSAVAATVNWTNVLGGKWSNPANWSPNKVPGSTDTAIVDAPGTYTVTIDANVSVAAIAAGAATGKQSFVLSGATITVANSADFSNTTDLTWNSGGFAGSGVITFHGPLRLTSPADKAINGVVVESTGNSSWDTASRIIGYNFGAFVNSGTLDLPVPVTVASGGFGSGPRFVNSGVVTAATNVTFSSVNFLNSGQWNVAAGTFASSASNFTNRGALNLTVASVLHLDSGTAFLDGTITAPTPDSLRFRGADVSIDTIQFSTPSLWQSGGTVRQRTNVVVAEYHQSGGTWLSTTLPVSIGTYAMTNGEFRGEGLTVTNFAWYDGGINRDGNGSAPVLRVPPGGQFLMKGSATRSYSTYNGNLPGHIVNQGAASWEGGTLSANFFSTFENAGSLAITAPASVAYGGFGSGPRFVNSGVVTAATNVTFSSVNFLNSGQWNAAAGTFVSSASNFTNRGVLNLTSASVLHLDSGSAYLDGTVTAPVPDSLRFRGADVSIDTIQLSTPSLWQSGGTVRQRTNVVVAEYHQSGGTWLSTTLPVSIGTYAMTNGEFRGEGLTVTNFAWYDGGINRDGNGSAPVLRVPPGGQFLMKGSATRSYSTYNGNLPGHIVNQGAASWEGGTLSANFFSTFENAGSLAITAPASVAYGGFGSGPRFVNSGVVTAATNVTFSSVNFLNSGQWNAAAGTFASSASNFTNRGVLNLTSASLLHLDSGAAYLDGTVTAPAPDSLRFRGADVSIDTIQLSTPSLWQSGGTVRQRTNVVVAEYHQSGGTWLSATLPVSIRTYAMTNGEFRGEGLTVTNFAWYTGGINRDGNGSAPVLRVPPGGQFLMKGTAGRFYSTYNGNLPGHVLNEGAAVWEGGTLSANFFSTFENAGSLAITAPASVAYGGFGSGPRFVNSGVVTAATNVTFSSVNFLNNGQWNASAGTFVSSASNFTNRGALNFTAASLLHLDSGAAFLEGTITAPGPDSLRFRGADVALDTIHLSTPSLWQSGGTVRQRTNVVVSEYHQSGGTWLAATLPVNIGAYAMTNGEFRGQGLTVSNFVWYAGSINRDGDGSAPVLTVPVDGLFQMPGTAGRFHSTYNGNFPGHIRNLGTATWDGGTLSGNFHSLFENVGRLDVSGKAGFAYGGFGAGPRFFNSGTVSFADDFAFSGGNVTNTASWSLGKGTQTFASCTLGQSAGSFRLGSARVAGSGTTAEFTGGSLAGNGEFGIPFVNKGATVSPGASPGVLQFPTFTMTAGVLDVELGRGIPGTNSDLIRVTGAATVGGTLRMKLLPGVGTNDQYTVVTAAQRSGTFATLQQPANGVLDASYSSTNVVLNLRELFQGSAPNVVLQPLDQTVVQGTDVTFFTTASGSEPLVFEWQFNGDPIDGASSTNLTLSSVQQSSHAGGYALVVRNDYGAITSRVARLNIRVRDSANEGDLASVAHWRFDEPPGSPVALDSSGNQYDGTLSPAGSVFVDGGRSGRALQITRNQSGWVNFGKILPFSNASFTAVIWVKFTDPDKPADYGDFMAHHAGGLSGWRLGYNRTAPWGSPGKAMFYAGGDAAHSPVSTTSVNDGAWHQVAFVHDVAGNSNSIFVDGSPAEQTTAGSTVAPADTELIAGNWRLNATPELTAYTGLLDEITFFDQPLTGAQIDYLFLNPSAGSVPPLVPPAISQQPSNQSAPPAGTATFSVAATGIGPFLYQWQFRGVDIPDATNATYTVTGASYGRIGRYRVKVSNEYGTRTSDDAWLTLDGIPNGLVAYFPLEDSGVDVVGGRDDTVNAAVQTGTYGAIGKGFYFNGVDATAVNPARFAEVRDNFTMVLWARPTAGVINWGESGSGTGGALGSPLAVWPDIDPGSGLIGMGIAIGTNGVATAEHTSGFLPLTTVVSTNIDNWVQVGVVVSNRTPHVYLNGTFVRRGINTGIGTIVASGSLGVLTYGKYRGFLDDYQIYDRALTPAEMASLYTPGISAPVFTQAPADTAVAPGDGRTFETAATGSEPLSWAWTYNGIPIPGATGTSIHRDNLQCGDGTGDYTVRVVNAHGEATDPFRVFIPAVETVPGFAGWYACEGVTPDRARWPFDVIDGSTPEDPILADGLLHLANATDAERMAYSKEGVVARFPRTGVIEFRMRLGAGDSNLGARGWVNVIASTGHGASVALHFTTDRVWFNTAGLTAGPAISTPTSDDFHTYRLEFDGLAGVQTVRLFKDGVEIGSGPMYADAGGTTPALMWGDGSVEARGASDWLFFRHSVGDTNLLAFSLQPTNQTAAFGAPVTFTAAATGAGPVRYQWRKGASNIENATNATYTIDGVVAASAGTFSVVATDDYVSVTSNPAVLAVTGGPSAPVITQGPVGQTVPAGAIVTFAVTATGTPPFTYQWQRNNADLPGETRSTLVLGNVSTGDNANYRVVVSNSLGGATSPPASLVVTPGVVPVPVADPSFGSRLNGVTFLNSLYGFVTGDNGIFRYTRDGGVTWYIGDPGVPNRITGATYYGGAYWIVGSGGLICVSYDGGLTWYPFDTGTSVRFNGIAFGTDGTGFAVGAGGTICVYRNGIWSPASGIPADVDFYGVYSFGGVTWAVGSRGTICVYRNGGWTAANTGGFSGTFYGVSFWDANYGYAVGSGGTICVTRNGGATWSPLNSGSLVDFYGVSFASADVIFVSGAGGTLCVSTNGGLTWIPLSSGTGADIAGVQWRDGIGYYVDASGRCRAFHFANFIPNTPPTATILRPLNTFVKETNVVEEPVGLFKTNVVDVRLDYTNTMCVVLPFRATGADRDGFVTRVDLFANGVNIGGQAGATLDLRWTNSTPGRYLVTAVATDNRGGVGYSDFVSIEVEKPLYTLVPLPLAEGPLKLCYCADTNRTWGLEFTTDFLHWQPLGPFVSTNSILEYIDPSILTLPARNYRAIEWR